MSRRVLLLGQGRIDRSGAKSSEGDRSHGVKGRGKASGIVLTLVLLSTLSLTLVPAAQALPMSSPHRAPWTPLPVSDPVTPLSGPISPPLQTLSGPESDDPGPTSAPFTSLSLPDGTDGIDTPGTGFLTSPLSGAAAPLAAQVETPEPATVILLGIGLLTMIIIGRRRGERVRNR
jgi:hypothetical protein